MLIDRLSQQRRLDSLVDDYAIGLLSRDQFTRAKGAAEAELERLDGDLDRANSESLSIDVPVGQTLREAWAQNDDDWRRSLLSVLVKRIVVNPGLTKPYYFVDGHRYRFDPALIDIECLA